MTRLAFRRGALGIGQRNPNFQNNRTSSFLRLAPRRTFSGWAAELRPLALSGVDTPARLPLLARRGKQCFCRSGGNATIERWTLLPWSIRRQALNYPVELSNLFGTECWQTPSINMASMQF
jgi:hypothetical protein